MQSRYFGIKVVRSNITGSQYYTNSVYPDIPVSDNDYYVITTLGDRLDLMAQDFYQDSSLWWIIALANALPGDSLYPPIGTQIRIPVNPQSVVTNYKNENNT